MGSGGGAVGGVPVFMGDGPAAPIVIRDVGSASIGEQIGAAIVYGMQTAERNRDEYRSVPKALRALHNYGHTFEWATNGVSYGSLASLAVGVTADEHGMAFPITAHDFNEALLAVAPTILLSGFHSPLLFDGNGGVSCIDFGDQMHLLLFALVKAVAPIPSKVKATAQAATYVWQALRASTRIGDADKASRAMYTRRAWESVDQQRAPTDPTSLFVSLARSYLPLDDGLGTNPLDEEYRSYLVNRFPLLDQGSLPSIVLDRAFSVARLRFSDPTRRLERCREAQRLFKQWVQHMAAMSATNSELLRPLVEMTSNALFCGSDDGWNLWQHQVRTFEQPGGALQLLLQQLRPREATRQPRVPRQLQMAPPAARPGAPLQLPPPAPMVNAFQQSPQQPPAGMQQPVQQMVPQQMMQQPGQQQLMQQQLPQAMQPPFQQFGYGAPPAWGVPHAHHHYPGRPMVDAANAFAPSAPPPPPLQWQSASFAPPAQYAPPEPAPSGGLQPIMAANFVAPVASAGSGDPPGAKLGKRQRPVPAFAFTTRQMDASWVTQYGVAELPPPNTAGAQRPHLRVKAICEFAEVGLPEGYIEDKDIQGDRCPFCAWVARNQGFTFTWYLHPLDKANARGNAAAQLSLARPMDGAKPNLLGHEYMHQVLRCARGYAVLHVTVRTERDAGRAADPATQALLQNLMQPRA